MDYDFIDDAIDILDLGLPMLRRTIARSGHRRSKIARVDAKKR